MQYGNKLGKFSFLTGLRLEYTQLKGVVESEFDLSDLEELLGQDVDLNFDKRYLGLFPTVNLIYELSENQNISLGYNRRINRPRGWFINPFPSRSSRTNIFQGNPDLDPAFANAFELGRDRDHPYDSYQPLHKPALRGGSRNSLQSGPVAAY